MKEPDFELSADMRLLELQRNALGLPARERTAWESAPASSGSLPVSMPSNATVSRGAVLAVETVAHPSGGVIPGAVVTLSLSVVNDGGVAAEGVVVGVPLPGGASYRPGSFAWNGRSSFDEVAESFFGTGLEIGSLAAGERASFQWRIGVTLGTQPLVVAPFVRAGGSAVLGARPLSIGRKSGPAAAFSGELTRADAASAKPVIPVEIPVTELPIYELDEEEQIVAEAAMAALSTAAPRAEPPPPAAVQPPPPEPEPEPETEPEPEPEAQAPAARSAIVLTGRFDRATIAYFERVFFGSKPPAILQHCILGGALACWREPGDAQKAQLKAHLDGQAQVLHRVALHEKLGKREPIGEYAGDLLARLDGLAPAPVAAPELPGDALLLSTELAGATVTVLARIAGDAERWDFVKARQLTLALQAESVDRAGLDDALRSRIADALRAYAQASVATLQKLFVRIRVDRTTAILGQDDPALDAAARALIAAFKLALP